MKNAKALIEAFAKILENPTLSADDYNYYKNNYNYYLKAVNYHDILVEALKKQMLFSKKKTQEAKTVYNESQILISKIEKG